MEENFQDYYLFRDCACHTVQQPVAESNNLHS